MEWIISACLLGDPCRYDGKSKPFNYVQKLAKVVRHTAVCPEVEGGLPTPRVPAEYDGNTVVNADGVNVEEVFRLGAQKVLKKTENRQAIAIMKEKSPSCGSSKRYDGSFSQTIVEGEGVTTKALYDAGITVVSEHDVFAVLSDIETDLDVVFRFQGILPALCELYEDELIDRCSCFIGRSAPRIHVVNEEIDLPQGSNMVIFDVQEDAKDFVYVPTVVEARASHKAKQEYFFGALVAEALDYDVAPKLKSHYKKSCEGARVVCVNLDVEQMPYEDYVQLMYRAILDLNRILRHE